MVVHALDALGLELALAERRQEERGQDGDNGDDDQQFNQREAARAEPMCGHRAVRRVVPEWRMLK